MRYRCGITMRYGAAIGLRAAGFGVAWWAVTAGAAGSAAFGIAASLLAAVASVALSPPPWPRLRAGAALAFVPYFIAQSLRGGLDVVRRAYDPRLPLAPAILQYDVAAMSAAERTAFALVANLLPGTLSAQLDGDALRVHAIDHRLPVHDSLATLDARIGAVFGRDTGVR